MGMIATRAAPSKATARAHDPDVCGLDPAHDCDRCRAAHLRADRESLERDIDAKERARLHDIEQRFQEATGIALADLAAALLPHLAEGMAEITGAFMDERGQHET